MAVAAGVGIVVSLAMAGMARHDAHERYMDQKWAAMQNTLSNAKLSLYDAFIAEQNAEEAELAYKYKAADTYELVNQLLSSNKARYGKAGVAVTTGSAQDVMLKTEVDGAKDVARILYEGRKSVDVLKDVAKRHRLSAKMSLIDQGMGAMSMEMLGGQVFSEMHK